jgi:hypothetical protein
MSTLAVQDSVGSLHNNADVYREGREALDRISTARDWPDWQKQAMSTEVLLHAPAADSGRTSSIYAAIKSGEPVARKCNRCTIALQKD